MLMVLGLAGSASAAAAADAAAPTVDDAASIRTVIEQQMAAFRRDDGVAAFGYASPEIQAMFGSPDNFMAMVRSGYAAVYRPRHVEFRDLASRDGETVQPVLVIGPDGVPVLALYKMQRQADGSWRIDGCTLAALSDKAA
jgi:hypothetical protein